jgi:tRNA-dihydrouridine synthase
MDGSLTKIILDAEIEKVTNSMNEIIDKFPERLKTIWKLNYVLKDLEHIKRHLNYLIKKYEKIT